MFEANVNLPDIDSLWNYEDPGASERVFLQLLPQAKQVQGEYLAQLLTQLARSQILQRRYDDGHATLDQVVPLLSADTPVAQIHYLLERGRAWNDIGRASQASSAFEEAFRLANERGFEALAVDAAHMLGVMEPCDRAAEWNRRAIDLAKTSCDPRARRWIGTLFINLGSNLQRMKSYGDAERAFEQAIPELAQIGNLQRVRLARLCLAKNRRLGGDPAGALTLLEPLAADIQAAGDPTGYLEEELAECCLCLNQTTEATKHFARAYSLLSVYPWFPPTELPRLERLRNLAGLAGNAIHGANEQGS